MTTPHNPDNLIDPDHYIQPVDRAESETPESDTVAEFVNKDAVSWCDVLERMRIIERDRNAIRHQSEMDNIRFREMQDAGAKLEVELDGLRQQLEKVTIERDGALHSSESWELLHAKRHEELASVRQQLAEERELNKVIVATIEERRDFVEKQLAEAEKERDALKGEPGSLRSVAWMLASLRCDVIDIVDMARKARRKHNVQGHHCELRSAIDSICDREPSTMETIKTCSAFYGTLELSTIDKLTSARDTAQAACAQMREALLECEAFIKGHTSVQSSSLFLQNIRAALSSTCGTELLADRERLDWLDARNKTLVLEPKVGPVYYTTVTSVRVAIDSARAKDQPEGAK